MSEELLITNVTGEPFQPARVYYQVVNQKTVLGVFKKLKCMDYDPEGDRWVWLYESEAKNLRFETSYNKIPKEKRPIVIGYFMFRNDQEMILELRSFERVIEALQFFTKRINWRAAEPKRLRIVNKLFTTARDQKPVTQNSFDEFFERNDIYIRNSETLEKEIMDIESQYEDPDEKIAAVNTYLEEKARQPLPEIEELEIDIHDGGIEVLNLALRMKHIETWERWNGNKDFVMQDLIERMLEDIPDEEVAEKELGQD